MDRRVLRVGLTGGIAAGKTVVGRMLTDRGALLIDYDQLSREVVEPGTPAWAAIIDRFGAHLLRPDGTLDRAALGEVVFADEIARAELNAIVHPAVRRTGTAREAAAPSGSVVIHDIPLLAETADPRVFDWILVIDVPESVQLARLMRRNGLSLDEALARLASQATRSQRLAIADVVIDNSGSLADTETQVDAIWAQLQAQAADPSSLKPRAS